MKKGMFLVFIALSLISMYSFAATKNAIGIATKNGKKITCPPAQQICYIIYGDTTVIINTDPLLVGTVASGIAFKDHETGTPIDVQDLPEEIAPNTVDIELP
ncbi:MAG: hypothetical protein JST82_03115 [Bacteroidetes bacterium]|nr:hypothetical protein [Bacteroidota bacterium]